MYVLPSVSTCFAMKVAEWTSRKLSCEFQLCEWMSLVVVFTVTIVWLVAHVAYDIKYVFHVINITGANCFAADGDLVMNSKCYRKFHSELTWYSASDECLSRGGSLAVFTGIGLPSDSTVLTNWLNSTGTDKIYWIGLVKSWWNTTNEGNICHYWCIECAYHRASRGFDSETFGWDHLYRFNKWVRRRLVMFLTVLSRIRTVLRVLRLIQNELSLFLYWL